MNKHICQGCGKEVTLRYKSNNKYIKYFEKYYE